MTQKIDILIIGAGLSGCTIAERCANALGLKIMLVDRRNHIAGNCYDAYRDNGILTHKYGPHYFRTNNPSLIEYLSEFTDWLAGNYIVNSFVDGTLFPFPINLNTLEMFFHTKLDSQTAKQLLEKESENINGPLNSEDFVLSRIGRKMYEAFYLNYTLKQWGIHPRELEASVCGRIPVRFNRDNRYVDHHFQLMPVQGYTAMMQRMINHPNIHLLLNTDYKELDLSKIPCVVYSGPIDEYFNYCYGQLPWRSLRFEYKDFDQEYVQPCVQINYPNEHEYTRSVEIKHVTGQKHLCTTMAYEYPTSQGEPYYPIPAPENRMLYEKYKALAIIETRENNVYFTGRLAEYAYLNMDEVIEKALIVFEEIKLNHETSHLILK